MTSSHTSINSSSLSLSSTLADLAISDDAIGKTVVPAGSPELQVEVILYDREVIGNGSFGTVYKAKLYPGDGLVAIKRVLQDRRFKNRELDIMRQLDHPNIAKLLYYFYEADDGHDHHGRYLNLIEEYVPQQLQVVVQHFSRRHIRVPVFYAKLYVYQLFRSIGYLHRLGICHRDIKPQNLLVSTETGQLKLCDFGSAKVLRTGEKNVSYICSRYYRAPELLFGSVHYDFKIDIWAGGCVLAELLLGRPLFPGNSGIDQMVEIIKVLGTPSHREIHEMNPNYNRSVFPSVRPKTWGRVFGADSPADAVRLIQEILTYTPSERLDAQEICAHKFFDELREEGTRLPNSNNRLPPLFNFSSTELPLDSELRSRLIPAHIKSKTQSSVERCS